MPFTLPPLPYAKDALEPYSDALTVEIHHDKHHQTYVNNLNAALEQHPDLASKSVEALLGDLNAVPEAVRQTVINNGGGVYNHNMFWEIMGPNKGGNPTGQIAEVITSTFGTFDDFKAKVKAAALGQFGSGWAFLVVNRDGKVEIKSYPNQNCPISDGLKPVMGIDVWEHAYYLKYKNVRADWVDAWWNIVNWDKVNERYLAK